jgi:small GTP-binding protein
MVIKKKICLLGAFAVGKTSLIQKFVYSIFSEKYISSVGVKIDKKTVAVNDQVLELLLWDLYGEDEFQSVQMSYLRGAAGYILVIDGTRRNTVDAALNLQTRAQGALGAIPYVLAVNKADLVDEWEVDRHMLTTPSLDAGTVIETSAKTGQGVEEAFKALAARLVG